MMFWGTKKTKFMSLKYSGPMLRPILMMHRTNASGNRFLSQCVSWYRQVQMPSCQWRPAVLDSATGHQSRIKCEKQCSYRPQGLFITYRPHLPKCAWQTSRWIQQKRPKRMLVGIGADLSESIVYLDGGTIIPPGEKKYNWSVADVVAVVQNKDKLCEKTRWTDTKKLRPLMIMRWIKTFETTSILAHNAQIFVRNFRKLLTRVKTCEMDV